MSSLKYDSELFHIEQIQFSVFKNDDIKKYSSVSKDINGINLPESYENGEPKRGGLVDTRLGITDSNLDCAYCGLNAKDCQGHFGHTNLVSPVFHYGFFKFVKEILSCICLRSSRLLAHKNMEDLYKIVNKYKGKKRFKEILKLSSGIKFSDVGVPVPKIKEEKKKNTGALYLIAETNISQVINDNGDVEDKKTIKEELSANDIYNIFSNISDEDFELLGFYPKLYRPEDLLIYIFPIPPVAIRPSLRADFLDSSTYEDDLTHKLADIIKTNEKFRIQREKELVSGEKSKYSNDLLNYLQYHLVTYFDNDKSIFLTSEQKVGGKKFKSISERIKSKKGRIRGNLMGKRVNYSARSVITSDPYLKLNELGIPRKIAMEITFPEVVTAYNIEKLTKLVRNGRYIYPGANFVIQGGSDRENTREYDLRYRKKGFKLRYGDVVERHLVNGDPVLFNRQPSLHKLSMMCHRAKIIDDDRFNTFRLNVNTTAPYNADFDGDEMNLFAPQSIQTQTELAMIADVNKMIISPKDSKPIIGPVQESILGSYKITKDDIEVEWSDVMNIIVNCMNVNLEKLKIDKNKKYSGKELFSMIIPKNINYTHKIKLDNGNLKEGIINKGLNKEIISLIWDMYNPKETADYIANIQKIVVNWMLYEGFTVGLGDCYVDKKIKDNVIIELEKKKLEIAYLITEIENNPDLLDSDIFESSIQNNLTAQKGDIQQLVMKNLNDDNNFYTMVNSGTKGSPVNIMQIMGALGQDIFKFKRIEKEVNNRTLPHFFQNDDTPSARGYIEHSYLDGLSPQEFFFHHMTGREGLIDTAIKTADSGYISRKLMKGMEDIGLKYDGTVRTGNNIILQYIYSDFNLDQTKQKMVKLNSIMLGNNEINKEYSLDEKELSELSKNTKVNISTLRSQNNNYIKELIELRNMLREVQRKILLNYKTLDTEFRSPVNFKRILYDIKNNKKKGNLLTPDYIFEKIEYILRPDITRLVAFNENNDNTFKLNDENRSKTLFKYCLYEYLCPKKLIFNYKLSKNDFDVIVNQIIKDFKKSQVQSGEMVGCLAAQHIGEPSTQMSISKDTKIHIVIKNKITNEITYYKDKVNKFVDNLMIKHNGMTINTGHFNSYETLLDNDENEYYVIGVNKNEKISYNKISHVSRHPSNGNLMKVITRTGRQITTTYSHSHLVRTKNSVEPITGDKLTIGNRIPVIRNVKQFDTIDNINDNKLDYELGCKYSCYLVNFYENMNYIDIELFFNNNFGSKTYIPSFVFNAPLDFIKGLIGGYYDMKGYCYNNIMGTSNKNKDIIRDLGLLHNYFGIYVEYHKSNDEYHCVIPNKYINKYISEIGCYNNKLSNDISNLNIINDNDKINGLDDIIMSCIDKLQIDMIYENNNQISRLLLGKIINMFKSDNVDLIKDELNILEQAYNGDIIWDEIVKIIDIQDPKEYVYDFTVPNNETFLTGDGIIVHNTLNTFHSTGSGSVGMQGIPRVEELMKASRNIKTPIMNIYMKKEFRENRDKANIIASQIENTIFKDIIENYEIIYDNNTIDGYTKKDNITNPFYVNIKTGSKSYENMKWLLRVKLDKSKLIQKNISLIDIKSSYVKFYKSFVKSSKGIKKNEKKIINSIIGTCILSNYDNSDNPIIHIRFDIVDFNYELLLNIMEWLIESFQLKGLDGIYLDGIYQNRLIDFENEDNKFEEKNEWVINTNGVDMLNIRNIEDIDLNRTYCNDINTILKCYGIEATRSALLKEYDQVFSGSNVNYHHLAILIDTMTNLGLLTSINRQGITNLDTDPLSRASFEIPIEQLTKASVFCEIDYMRSVSSRIMAGRVINGGTGLCELILDSDFVMNSEYIEDLDILERSEFNKLESNNIINDILKRDNYNVFKFNM